MDEKCKDREDSSEIVLEPFVHQVSGHCPMICVEDLSTSDLETHHTAERGKKYALLCKPLEMQELKFYQTTDPALYPHVPTCYGSVEVDFEIGRAEDDRSRVKFSTNKVDFLDLVKSRVDIVIDHAYVIEDKMIPESTEVAIVDVRSRSTELPTLSPQTSNMLPASPSSDESSPVLDDRTIDNLLSNDLCSSGSTSDKMIMSNPWAQKCFRTFLRRKLSRLNSGGDLHKSVVDLANNVRIRIPYLLLENFVPHGEFVHPSVIDLKLGPRQHSDDCSDAKRDRKISKAKNTTSSLMGLRLSGMQLYCSSQDRYTYMDKFDGRRLSIDQLKDVVWQFCQPLGQAGRGQIVDRLRQIREVIERLDSYRFYTSSILVAYECPAAADSCRGERFSETITESNDSRLVVKLIDFAHSTNIAMEDYFVQAQKCVVDHTGPDEGLLFGLDNLIQILAN